MHDALCRNGTLIKGHTHKGNKMQQCNCDMPNLVEHCPCPKLLSAIDLCYCSPIDFHNSKSPH